MTNMINAAVAQIKQNKPLVLNLTNYVTVDFVANGLLSLGASPVMSKAKQEIEDLLILADTVVINLGTLNEEFINLCEYTCRIANQLNKPIIIDPVGAGASTYRTVTNRKLIDDFNIAIIRGNAYEIAALSGLPTTFEEDELIENAQLLSKSRNTAIVMSGEIDVIIDCDRMKECDRGSPMMSSITGTGCLLSGVVGAFHAINPDRFEAAVAATVFYGICGELAEKRSKGPGSFKTQFLDMLYTQPEQGQHEFTATKNH